MTPIRDIAELTTGSVLYHSAFGFARVASVDDTGVVLAWQEAADHLPGRVPLEVLPRVYALCAPDGFFDRNVHEHRKLQAMLEEHPMDALRLLLADLPGVQSPQDLREWLVGTGLLTADGFIHWFEVVRSLAVEDGRFAVSADGLLLRGGAAVDGPRARFDNPLLAPGRRLDLALVHRDDLDDESWIGQVALAWRTGGSQVRDLALAALRDQPPDRQIQSLLAHGTEAIDALIHGIRRGGWDPDRVSLAVHTDLVALVLRGPQDDGSLDNEGRLAAALIRWPTPGIVEGLSDVAAGAAGKRLVRATLSALPPRRGEALVRDLLALARDTGDEETARWLEHRALGASDDASRESVRAYTPDSPRIELEDLAGRPTSFADLPPRSGQSLLGLGIAMARALRAHHRDGRVVNPVAERVRLLPNETIEIDPGDGMDPAGPHPQMEPPSFTADVHAAGVLLLESVLGRRWPRSLAPSRAIPFLHLVARQLDPAALAPLDAALHPDPERRPADGQAWLSTWEAAVRAAERRAETHDSNARLQLGYDTHVGRMKTLLTQTNQDCMAVAAKGSLALIVVCDGISTANAGTGDVASSIAAHVIANLWEQALPQLALAGPAELADFLDRALRTANSAVCEAAMRFAGGTLEGRVPMGTTCTVAVASGSWVSLAWLGDSRAYLVGPYGAAIVTGDENQAGERLRSWHLGLTDAWDPAGYALVGYIGHFDERLRPEGLAAHHTSFHLLPDEQLVLCSDGVSDYVGDSHPEVSREIAAAVARAEPEVAARALVDLANRGGGGDNASCVVARIWQ